MMSEDMKNVVTPDRETQAFNLAQEKITYVGYAVPSAIKDFFHAGWAAGTYDRDRYVVNDLVVALEMADKRLSALLKGSCGFDLAALAVKAALTKAKAGN